MLKKLNTWYRTQHPTKQLGLVFLFNFLLWFALSYVADFVFPDIDKDTLKHRLFHAIWMALCWSVFFNWKLVKYLFSNEAKSTPSN